MKKNKIIKILSGVLVTASVLSVTSISANAEWKQDNNGWWYAKPSGGYYQNEWFYDMGKWYHFNSDGYMESNTTVDGYSLGNNGEYIPAGKKVTNLKNGEIKNLPPVTINGVTMNIKSLNKNNAWDINDDIISDYYDSNGNPVILRTTNDIRAEGDPSTKVEINSTSYYTGGWGVQDISGKVDTVVYRNKSGNVLYKSKLRNNKLYFYDENDKPLANTIVNGQVTDNEGAWRAGDFSKLMSEPADKSLLPSGFTMHVYPEQLDEIYLDVNAGGNTPESIAFSVNNNSSDINNNIGDFKFKDSWETYRLSDDKSTWVDAAEELSKQQTTSDSSSIYTVPYRGYYNVYFDRSSSVYKEVFSKAGTYLVMNPGLGLVDIVNVQ